MKVTEVQSRILGFIEGCQAEGWTPSYAEIAKKVDRTISTVHYQLHQLALDGFIELPPGKNRRIIIR